MGALLPILLSGLPSLINLVEGLFVKSKSGVDKLDAVKSAVQQITQKALDTGVVAVRPTDPQVEGIIETVLAQMRQNGTLGGQSASGPAGETYLVVGKVIPLKAA